MFEVVRGAAVAAKEDEADDEAEEVATRRPGAP